ncbi:MAG: hypothetical protein GX620_16965 [Chloroflexi bacterium]|nr:hypothetical protein [Chloroflexota bacterium]
MQPIIWEKRGLLLGPESAPTWREAHSGMVSVLPWAGDTYRVFLTGRDACSRFQIGWLDLNRDFTVVYENPANPVLSAGRMGCFDSQGVCMPSVVRVSDSVLYMYYVGWEPGLAGTIVNNCGLAISEDNGATWHRWSEAPVLPRDAQDPIGTGTVYVLRGCREAWRMWYTTFRNWRLLEDGTWRHFYHIKYAESDDGIHWHKPPDNIAVDFADEWEYAVARPVVLQEPDGYRMWFCTRSAGSSYRIGYAESVDGRHWSRAPSGIEPSADGWDADMVEYAYVLKENQEYLMFYNGNGFGASGTGVARGFCREETR